MSNYPCIKCDNTDTQVRDSRIAIVTPGDLWNNQVVRRKRECYQCGTRWSTLEVSLDSLASAITAKDLTFEQKAESLMLYFKSRRL